MPFCSQSKLLRCFLSSSLSPPWWFCWCWVGRSPHTLLRYILFDLGASVSLNWCGVSFGMLWYCSVSCIWSAKFFRMSVVLPCVNHKGHSSGFWTMLSKIVAVILCTQVKWHHQKFCRWPIPELFQFWKFDVALVTLFAVTGTLGGCWNTFFVFRYLRRIFSFQLFYSVSNCSFRFALVHYFVLWCILFQRPLFLLQWKLLRIRFPFLSLNSHFLPGFLKIILSGILTEEFF